MQQNPGKYYISILGEDGKEVPVKQAFSESTTIGVDFRITDFAVMLTGEMVENPKYLKNSLKKLKVLQKKLVGNKKVLKIEKSQTKTCCTSWENNKLEIWFPAPTLF